VALPFFMNIENDLHKTHEYVSVLLEHSIDTPFI
jgi:hypothetical protein